MNTITIGRTTYKLRDTSTIFADHAKCLGKHKPVKSRGGEKRLFPKSGDRMSTADYVNSYQVANDHFKIMPWDWQALTEHVSQAQGEDTFEVEA